MIHPLQAMVNGMNAEHQRQRAGTQMTLGALIARLEQLSPNVDLSVNLRDPHSYRGYYCDLAFEPHTSDPVQAGDLLYVCKECMGRVFKGYKGGDFMMGERTPVWVSFYGTTGDRLMAIEDDGTVVTAPDDSY